MPTYNYETYGCEPCAVFPDGSQVHRAVVRIVLYRGEFFSSEFEAIVDTGADYCIFPAEWAGITDAEWDVMPSLEIETRRGDRSIRFTPIQVRVEGIGKLDILAGFTKEPMRVGVLGHHGFIDRHKVTFDCPAGKFTIEANQRRT
jgi:hypothetical protein